MKFEIFPGDCREVLKSIPDSSMDSVVTDPPSGIKMMGREWDHFKPDEEEEMVEGRAELLAFQNFLVEVFVEVLRVLKPGAFGVVWALPRTSHHTGMALERAGFEIRDVLYHVFSQGYRKGSGVSEKLFHKIKERYGSEECLGEVDSKVGCYSRNHARFESSRDSQVRRVLSVGSTLEVEDPLLQESDKIPGSNDLHELRERDESSEVRCGEIKETLLLKGMRGCWSKKEGLRDPEVRKGLEENKGSNPKSGQDLSVLQKKAKRSGKPSGTPPKTISSRGNESTEQSDSPVRIVPPQDRSIDNECRRLDPDRHDPRRVIPDREVGGESPVIKVCSWCGKPDSNWLDWVSSAHTGLKPATEEWILIRKPLDGTVTENILRYGTGVLDIDSSRILTDWNEPDRPDTWKKSGHTLKPEATKVAAPPGTGINCHPLGRWPSNLILSHSTKCKRVGTKLIKGDPRGNCNGTRPGGFYTTGSDLGDGKPNSYVYGDQEIPTYECVEGCPVGLLNRIADNSRYFKTFNPEYESNVIYQAKPSTKEKNEDIDEEEGLINDHPTVKSKQLMKYLVKLVTPPEGVVIDPFAGSGTTLVAALEEGFDCIGIEKDPKSLPILRNRVDNVYKREDERRGLSEVFDMMLELESE